MSTPQTLEADPEVDSKVRVTPFTDPERRLFIGIYPGGVVYSDRWFERHHDYMRLAFLPYTTLRVEFQDDCPADLRAEIEQHVREMNLQVGQQFQISSTGQSITLGPSPHN